MLVKFKPKVESFEDRTVPAVFSFQFPDGTVGSGQFSTPVGVNPSSGFQELPIADLAVTFGGQAYAVQPGAVANYSYGDLLGVEAEVTRSGSTLVIDDTGADFEGYGATVVYDAADTKVTFTLPDGVAGAISYDIPWVLVDPEAENQSLAPTNFVLNVAGQNLTPATASFTTPPLLHFESGVLTGVTFEVDTGEVPDFRFTRVSASGETLSAYDPVTGTTLNADLAPTGVVNFDFSTVRGGAGGEILAGSVTITVKLKGAAQPIVSAVDFQRGISQESLAALVAADLKDRGVAGVTVTGKNLSFNGNANDPLERVDFVITANNSPKGGKSKEVKLTINGVEFGGG